MSNIYDQGSPANTSGVHPCGHAVLVKPYVSQKKDSLIVLPDTVKDRTQMLEDRATVIEIGKAAWQDEPEARCKVGDRIYIPYLAGRTVPSEHALDGQLYRLINDRDVIAVIDQE